MPLNKGYMLNTRYRSSVGRIKDRMKTLRFSFADPGLMMAFGLFIRFLLSRFGMSIREFVMLPYAHSISNRYLFSLARTLSMAASIRSDHSCGVISPWVNASVALFLAVTSSSGMTISGDTTVPSEL